MRHATRRDASAACLALALAAAPLAPGPARADEASALFEEALRADDGRAGGAERAFSLFSRAAEKGMPEAQLNVGVMLDSGRGTPPDAAAAATWYARAAVRGDQRAAYNLGQLYEKGEGVPRNAGLARAWFAASKLAAARAHLSEPAPPSPAVPLRPVYPRDGQRFTAAGGVELVWTGSPAPARVEYFVELREIRPPDTREIFTAFSATSGVLAPIPASGGRYAWRVSSVDRRAGAYEASPWAVFDAAP